MPAERGPSGTGHDTAGSESVLNRVLLCPHRKDCLANGCTGCCEQDPPLCRDGSNVTHRPADRVTEAAPALKHGDRVTITAAWHPWKGHSGTLIEQPPSAAFKWAVEMDDGYSMRAQVNEDEVTRV